MNNAGLERLKNFPIDSNDIVFIGTSITEGLPIELFPEVKIKNRGIGWNRTTHIMNRLDDIEEAKPRKLFIEAGINDIRKGQIDPAIDNYRQIIHAIKYYCPKTEIFAQSALPVTGEFSGFNHDIIIFNDELRALCLQEKIRYINLYPLFVKSGRLDSAYSTDNLHLNIDGYKKMVGAIDSLIR